MQPRSRLFWLNNDSGNTVGELTCQIQKQAHRPFILLVEMKEYRPIVGDSQLSIASECITDEMISQCLSVHRSYLIIVNSQTQIEK